MTHAFRRLLPLAALASLAAPVGAARWEQMPGTSATMAVAIDRDSIDWSGDTGSFWAKFVQTGFGTNSGNYQNAMFQVNCANNSIRLVDGATPAPDPSFRLSDIATPEFMRAQPATMGLRLVATVCQYRAQDEAAAAEAAREAERERASVAPKR